MFGRRHRPAGTGAIRSRPRALSLAALLALVGVGALAAPAALAVNLQSGEGGALNELTRSGQTETNTTATTASKTVSNQPTNSKTTVLLAMGAAVLLLSGIGVVIARDARRRSPAPELELAQGSSARHSEAALRKRRNKAKAARQQRKRNKRKR